MILKCKTCKLEHEHSNFTYQRTNTSKTIYFNTTKCRTCMNSREYKSQIDTNISLDGWKVKIKKDINQRDTNRINKILKKSVTNSNIILSDDKVDINKIGYFIRKVNIRGGWIDDVDAFILTSYFTSIFGELNTKLNKESELLYMWNKLNTYLYNTENKKDYIYNITYSDI